MNKLILALVLLSAAGCTNARLGTINCDPHGGAVRTYGTEVVQCANGEFVPYEVNK